MRPILRNHLFSEKIRIILYWFNYWYSPIELLSAWLQGNRITIDWPQFRNRRIIYSYIGRNTIVMAYRLLHLLPGDEVLVPSYNCGSEIDPLLWCGAKTVFYRVDSHAMIDIQDIQARVTSKTRAVYVTHYFGWPQSVKKLSKWCKEHNILLIEDCALSLFSEGPEGPVGSIGDAAIYSLWKTVLLPDGGALSLRESNMESIKELHPPGSGYKMQPLLISLLRNSGRKYLGSFYKRIKHYINRKKEISRSTSNEKESAFPQMPHHYHFDESTIDWDMSRLSKGLVNRVDPKNIIQARRKNYNLLYEATQDIQGIRPLYDSLPSGVCPLVFPILVSEPKRWERLLKELDVYPFRWWKGYHPALSWDGFPEAIHLKNHVLAFRVDQQTEEKDIDKTIDSIKAVSLKMKK